MTVKCNFKGAMITATVMLLGNAWAVKFGVIDGRFNNVNLTKIAKCVMVAAIKEANLEMEVN